MLKGLIPIVLGTGVTAAGASMKMRSMKKKYMNDLVSMFSASLTGFGLAHIVLGSIDLVKDIREIE